MKFSNRSDPVWSGLIFLLKRVLSWVYSYVFFFVFFFPSIYLFIFFSSFIAWTTKRVGSCCFLLPSRPLLILRWRIGHEGFLLCWTRGRVSTQLECSPTSPSPLLLLCIYLSISCICMLLCMWKALRETDPDRWFWMCVCVCVWLFFFSVFVIFSFALLFSQFVELHVSFSFSISLSPSPIMYTSRAGKLFCNSRSSSSVGCPAGGALQSVERATERGAPAQVGGAETTSKRKRFDSLSLFCLFFSLVIVVPIVSSTAHLEYGFLCACNCVCHSFKYLCLENKNKNPNRRWQRKSFVNNKKKNAADEWKSSAYATWSAAPRSRSAKRPSWKRNANDGRPCYGAVKIVASGRRRNAATNADPSPLPLAAQRRGCWSR